MFVNKYRVKLNTSGTTDMFYDIPLSMEYQLVDQAELANQVFVDVETKKAINPIIDYEKIRYLPLDYNDNPIDGIVYLVNFKAGNTYGDIGFTDDDIKFRRNYFTNSFLELTFYDTDNPLTQSLVSYVTLYSELKPSDLNGVGSTSGVVGQPRPANQILVSYILQNPLLNKRSFSEGFHIYDYKDELNIGEYKYLYMKASFKNAKTGKATNLMVKKNAVAIDQLIHELYTKVKLYRTKNGYYYDFDDTYQGNGVPAPNNVRYTLNPTNNTIIINFYQIDVL